MFFLQLCGTFCRQQTHISRRTCHHLAKRPIYTRRAKICSLRRSQECIDASDQGLLSRVVGQKTVSSHYVTKCSQIEGQAVIGPDVTDPVVLLKSLTSVEEVLSHADRLGSKVEPFIPAILDKLVSVRYRELQESSPRLHLSTRHMHEHLSTLGVLEENMQPVTNSPMFKKMLQVIENRLHSMPWPEPKKHLLLSGFGYRSPEQRNSQRHNQSQEPPALSTVGLPQDTAHWSGSEFIEVCDLPHIHFSLINLGLEESEPVMQSLWLLSRFNLHKMNYRSLYFFSHFTPFTRIRLACLGDMLELHSVAMACPPQNMEDLASYACIVKLCAAFLPPDRLASSLSLLGDATRRIYRKTTDIDLLANLARTISLTGLKEINPEDKNSRQIIKESLELLLLRSVELVDLLCLQDLKSFTRSAKRMGSYSTAVKREFGRKALTYLSKDLSLLNASTLLTCLDPHMYPREAQQLIDIVLEKLDQESFARNVELLRELSLKIQQSSDVNIIHKFIVNDIKQHMNCSLNFILPVMGFVRQHPLQNQKHKDAFARYILRVLDSQPHIATSRIALMAFNLLGDYNHRKFPNNLCRLVLKTLSSRKNNSAEFLDVVQGLAKSRRSGGSLGLTNYIEIQEQLIESMIEQQDCLREDTFSRSVLSLSRGKYLFDASLFDSLMHLYIKFTHESRLRTGHAFFSITDIFHSIAYFMPKVLENLTEFVIKNPSEIKIGSIGYFLTLLSLSTYTPKNFEDLLQVVWRSLDEVQSDQKPSYEVQVLCDLAKLQCFPESRLRNVFTVEYMERLEEGATGVVSGKGHYVEIALKQLNRAVILECPHLSVPWFSEHLPTFHKPELKHREGSIVFELEVWQLLSDILGGQKFVKSEVETQYGYTVDLELILDNERHPVPYSEELMDRTHQRVAVLLLQPGDYCLNVPRLKGDIMQKLRHLQIMGYEVVEIPSFEWVSMGYQSDDARMEYLANKVFNARRNPGFGPSKSKTN